MSNDSNLSNPPVPAPRSLWGVALRGAFLGACAFLVMLLLVYVAVWAIVAALASPPPWHWPTIGATTGFVAVLFIGQGAFWAVQIEKKKRLALK
jgi:hypothetical protein